MHSAISKPFSLLFFFPSFLATESLKKIISFSRFLVFLISLSGEISPVNVLIKGWVGGVGGGGGFSKSPTTTYGKDAG
jgi:hypothetical protein